MGEVDYNLPTSKILQHCSTTSNTLKKSSYYIAAYNTLTLRTDESLQELVLALDNIKWSIIGLSEVRRYGEKIEEFNKFIFYYKGETPGKYGVGFLIKKELKDHIKEIIGISERIAILNLTIGKEYWSIVQIYSPTEQASITDIDSFYSKLNSSLKQHAHKNLIVMGDFNARVGERRGGEDIILGPFSYGKRTRNGEKLLELAYENNLKILNTNYKNRSRWTWESPDGVYKNEIDYILTNKSNLFEDCRNVKHINFNTNHRMIRAKLTVKEFNKRRPFKLHTYTKQVDIDINELKSQLLNFPETVESLNLQTKYNKLSEILSTAANRKTREGQDKNRKSDIVTKLLGKRLHLISTKVKTKEIRKQISNLSKQIKETIRKDCQAHRLETLEKYIAKTGGVKKALKILTDKKEWIPKIQNKTGYCTTSRPGILDTATEFYRDLYKSRNNTPETDLSGDDEEIPVIMPREVEKAIETLKKDKSPGPDNITNEFLIKTKDVIVEVLTRMFNDVIKTETIPEQWLTSTIILLHKKGEKSDIGNYRPISLMSNIYKVFSKVILNRITKKLDENQPREQAGFRSGYSTLDHIHVVKQIIEKSKEYNMPLYCCFVDYSKAFDSLEHEKIWQALKNQGIENKYIRIIRNIYKNSSARIKLEREGKKINIERGVRQGDPLSPKLFSAVLEEIFRHLEWETYGLNINGEKLNHLRFADDLIILSNTPAELSKMIQELDKESHKVGLSMNTSKTKAMTNSKAEAITLNGNPIEYVEEYTYLGQVISPIDQTSKEIETRIGNAWKRYWTFKEVMKNKEMSINIKRKLYNACILPVLTYGCQTWALTKAKNNKLEVCQRSMERSMLNIKKSDRVRNAKIREKTKLENVTFVIRKNKWRWTGHTMRGVEKWSKIITTWYPRNKIRKCGRQFKRWEDEVKSVAGKIWSRTAKDRESWKKLGEAFAKQGQTEKV